MKGTRSWFNYRTQEYDHLVETPQDFQDYIPQSGAAQNMYALLISKMGYEPINAAMRVLEAAVGKREHVRI